MMELAARLEEGVRNCGTRAIVGLDTRPELLPLKLRMSAAAHPAAIRWFNRRVLDVVAGRVAAVKVQVALYEALGPSGMRVLADTLRDIRSRGLVAIADAKLGDIAATAEAYARAFLDPGAPFEADAVTLNPYLGEDALVPFLERVKAHGRGVFVLVRTSNPSASRFQDEPAGDPLALRVARWLAELGERQGTGPLGAVVGAPFPSYRQDLWKALAPNLLLVPGYGAQGTTAAEVVAGLAGGPRALVHSARRVIHAYATRVGSESGMQSEEEAAAAPGSQSAPCSQPIRTLPSREEGDRWQDAVAAALDRMVSDLEPLSNAECRMQDPE